MRGLLLIRHPKTLANQQRRYLGHSDSPCDPHALAAFLRVAERLAKLPITRIYSSDLGRAVVAAAQLGALLHLPVEQDARLREMNFGAFEGLTHDEVMAFDRSSAVTWYENMMENNPPRGETGQHVAHRALHVLRELGEDATRTKRLYAVVSHGGPLRLYLAERLYGDCAKHFDVDFFHGRVFYDPLDALPFLLEEMNENARSQD